MQKKEIQVGLGQIESAASVVAQISTSHKFKSVSDSYWFNRTTQNVSRIFEKMSKIKNELIQDYAEKDEKGLIKGGASGIQIVPEKKEAFQSAFEELYNLRETRLVFQLPLEALNGCALTPAEIVALVGIWIYEPRDVEEVVPTAENTPPAQDG
jgi:hypothetical protein